MTTKRTNPGVGDVDIALEIEQRVQQAISPEARAAFRELQADAPTGEGPIVRRARRLLTPSAARDAEESERKEHVPRAELHTNPLPAPAPAASVLRKPRVEGGDVTLPGAKKREALAPLAIEGGGRSVAGTQRLAAMPRVPEGSPAAALEELGQQADAPAEAAASGPAWPRVLVMLLIAAALAGVVAMVVWFWGYVSEVEQRSTAPVKTSAPPVTATAIATPLSVSPAPSESAIAPSTEEPTAKASATSERTSTAKASAKRSATSSVPTASIRATQSAKPAAGTSTSERPND